jgi:hypothetical protein
MAVERWRAPRMRTVVRQIDGHEAAACAAHGHRMRARALSVFPFPLFDPLPLLWEVLAADVLCGARFFILSREASRSITADRDPKNNRPSSLGRRKKAIKCRSGFPRVRPVSAGSLDPISHRAKAEEPMVWRKCWRALFLSFDFAPCLRTIKHEPCRVSPMRWGPCGIEKKSRIRADTLFDRTQKDGAVPPVVGPFR